MRALTLTQPWCGLVASGIKLIENRSRPVVKPDYFGELFALHASREIDERVYSRIFEIAPELPGRTPAEWGCRWHKLSRITSAVIGVAVVDKVFRGWDAATIAEHADALSDSRGVPLGPQQVRWFFGPVGYVLRDVRALPTPVPCKGALGFWTLPANVEAAVRFLATPLLQPPASSSEIERSGGGVRTVLEAVDGAPTCGNDSTDANPCDQPRTVDVANLVTATSTRYRATSAGNLGAGTGDATGTSTTSGSGAEGTDTGGKGSTSSSCH